MTTILELLDLARTGPDAFRGPSADEPDWVYGGQVVAQALAAASATVPADRPAHSVQAHYLRQGKGGAPVDYTVSRLRDGGSFSARQVSAHQDGRVLAVVEASFHVGEELFGHQVPMPEAPPPASAPPPPALAGTDPGWPRWLPGRPDLDVRRVVAGGPRHGESLAWSRVTVDLPDDPWVHACAWAYLSDLTLLATIRGPYEPEPGVRRRWRMMTLNHAIWLHRPLRADRWLLLDQYSPTAAAGRGLSTASVFSADGRLVSSLAQEGVGRPLAVT